MRNGYLEYANARRRWSCGCWRQARALPTAASAIGRAWLAGLEPTRRAAVMADLERHYGARWPAIRIKLERALRTTPGVDSAWRTPREVGPHREQRRRRGGAQAARKCWPSISAARPPGSRREIGNLGPASANVADALQARLWQGRGYRHHRHHRYVSRILAARGPHIWLAIQTRNKQRRQRWRFATRPWW
ncbi:hypothetical protein ACU4GD_26920 [Cupriavidus basilensis]